MQTKYRADRKKSEAQRETNKKTPGGLLETLVLRECSNEFANAEIVTEKYPHCLDEILFVQVYAWIEENPVVEMAKLSIQTLYPRFPATLLLLGSVQS